MRQWFLVKLLSKYSKALSKIIAKDALLAKYWSS
jgi:hypothetical protein